MLSLAYGCGLPASEVAWLRGRDIDNDRMIIRIVQSKGRKDRNVMLPAEIPIARFQDTFRTFQAAGASRPPAENRLVTYIKQPLPPTGGSAPHNRGPGAVPTRAGIIQLNGFSRRRHTN